MCKKASALLPVYLSLLVDEAVGLFSGYPTVEPQLSYVDDCGEEKQWTYV